MIQRYKACHTCQMDPEGEWCKYSDAMEEKFASAQASFDNGFQAGAASKEGRAEPRCTCDSPFRSPFRGYRHSTDCPCYKPPENIWDRGKRPWTLAQWLQWANDNGATLTMHQILDDWKASTVPCYKPEKPGKIERLEYDVDWIKWGHKINELIDAVNTMREK